MSSSKQIVPQAGSTEIGEAEFYEPQPTGGDGGESPAGSGIDFRRYLAAVNRYRWLIMLVTLLGTGAGLVANRFVAKQYMAQATVWIEAAPRADGPIQQGQLLTSFSWVELLTSFSVLDPVVRERRLYLQHAAEDTTIFERFDIADRFVPGTYRLEVSPDAAGYRLTTSSGALAARGTPGDTVAAAIGFVWTPPAEEFAPGRRVDFTVNNPRETALSLRNRLKPTFAIQRPNFLGVTLVGPGPEVSATLNAVLDRYVELAAQLKREKLTNQRQILEEQMRTAEQNLTRAEVALETFRVRTITLPSERGVPIVGGVQITRDPVFTRFFEDQVARDMLRSDRERLDRAISGDSISIAGLESISSVQQSSEMASLLLELTDKRAELMTLRARYTEQNPAVTRLVDEVRNLRMVEIPTRARALRAELELRERDLDQRIAAVSREMQQIPLRQTEEARLARNVEIASTLHGTLQSRYETARLAEASSQADVRVLDAAVQPRQPINNTGPRLILMAFAGSLGFAIAGALLLDRIDRRVRYAEQVSRELGLTILGVVPRANGGGAGEAHLVVEALRGIRLNIMHAQSPAPSIVLTVSSPGTGDGKSFISANLALSFADAGNRTLLIDGDVRRGGLHKAVSANRKPGLTDHLANEHPLAAVIQHTQYKTLDFIGCGSRRTAAPEWLGSAAMSELLAATKPNYDVIIVDSPPLGAGVDPFALGTLTGNMLLVFRTGSTDRALAEAKLEVIDRLPVRMLGAILNDVKPGASMSYYSYSLPGYYVSADEDEEDVQAEALVSGEE